MTGGDVPVDRETAFVALFDAYYAKILAYATRRLGPDAATDVVADTFVTAWLKLELIDAAETRGQGRMAETNRQLASNLEKIIAALEDSGSSARASDAS